MPRDKIFSQKAKRKEDFNFGKKTAEVFDDMLERSVPFYDEVQRMVSEIARSFSQDKTNIYDLGCSTGTTMRNIAENIMDKKTNIIGIDNSEFMLRKAKNKLKQIKTSHKIFFEKCDLNSGIALKNASVVVMNLTLQFVRPLHRDRIVKTIYNSLNSNGAFILIEKVLGEDSTFNRIFIDLYYDFKKRQGYSSLEIAQKREALENVLIPYRLKENIELLKRNGFLKIDMFFKWYNFCGVVAVK